MNESRFGLERFNTVSYQLGLLVITLGACMLMLYKPVAEFHPNEPRPFVNPITPEVLQQWGTQPHRVKVGFNISDFLRFDMVKNDILINAFIWFAYDPKQISAEVIDKFTFTKGDVIKKSEPVVTQTADGLTMAQYTIRVAFSTIADYTRFPIDDHTIFLNLTNPAVSAKQMVYECSPSDYVISKSMYLAGWKPLHHDVRCCYSTVDLGSETLIQPKTTFSLDVSKQDLRQVALIFLPLLFLFYLGLLTFAIRDAAIAMTFPLASISALFAYSFVIQTLAPAVGYFMLSDYMFLFFLASLFVIFVVGALTAIPQFSGRRATVIKIEGATVLALHILLLCVWYYITNVHALK